MVTIPSLGSMLLVLGIALVITVLASAALGGLLALVTERRPSHRPARPASPAVPAQRAGSQAGPKLISASRS